MKQTSEIIYTTNQWTEFAMLKELKKDLKEISFGSGIGTYGCEARVTITVEKLPEPKKEDRRYYEDMVKNNN